MNVLPEYLCALFLWGWCLSLGAARASREVLDLNPDWKYLSGGHPGAEQPAYGDRAWEPISLFSII